MAFTTITLTNGTDIKRVPLGFSWTTFFFGGWIPIIRQDWLIGVILLIITIFTGGITGIMAAFFYNKIYAKSLFKSGYYIYHLPDGITEDHVCQAISYIKLPESYRAK